MSNSANKETFSQHHTSTTNRRSIRRIKKLLQKNLSQYEIPNPYRRYQSHPYLPASISKQLAKLDFLSLRTLASLRIKDIKETFYCGQGKEMLAMMKVAVQMQETQFGNLAKIVQQRMNSLYSQPKKTELPTTQTQVIQFNPQSQPDLNQKQVPDQQFYAPLQQIENLQDQDEQYQNIGLHRRQSSILSDNYEQEMAHYKYNFQLQKNIPSRIRIGDLSDIGGSRNTNGNHGVSAEDHEEHFYF